MAIKKKIVEKKVSTTMQKKEDMKKGSPAKMKSAAYMKKSESPAKMSYGKSPAKMSCGTSPAKQMVKSSAKATPAKMKKC